MTRRLPVTVVGGYLGAGKTTLLNALLHGSHGIRLAVIVNDFGSVSIDAALMANRHGETISLTNGCVCCTVGDSLARTLHDLAARQDGCEQIIIEASGVADLNRVAAFGASHPRLALACIVAVADAEAIRRLADDCYVGDLVRGQLAAADIVVPSKTDLISACEYRQVRAWLAAEAPRARVLTNTGDLSALLLFAGAHVAPAITHQPVPHFATWTFADDRPLDGARLRAAVAALPKAVIRAKGLVTLADAPDQRFVLQLAGRRWSLEPATETIDPTDRSVIVCIGLAEQWDQRRLETLFADCRV